MNATVSASVAGLAPAFQPLPLLGNAHVQTVLGTLWAGKIPPLTARQQTIVLPDGDQLLIYHSTPASWQVGDWIAILVHGMGGSYRSASMRRLTTLLLAEGLRVVRVNLRGADASWKVARQLYHAGRSDDIRVVTEELARCAPGSPLVLAGFSLGGNIVLKLAGEASLAPVANLAGVAALSAPIDIVRSSALISDPSNRLYERYYLRKLVQTAQQHQQYFPDLPQVVFPRRLTMRLFDDLHTAPRGGFADALDYYRRTSAMPWVPHIGVPAFLLTARDDPFVAVEPYEALPRRPMQHIHVVDSGGHLGFLGDDGAGGFRWAERRVAEWMVRLRNLATARSA
jgi:predicted alpha/beta-fold hydrolase